MLLPEGMGCQMKTLVPGLGYFSMSYWAGGPMSTQSNTGYCHGSWLATITRWQDLIAEDMTHFWQNTEKLILN